MKGAREKSCGHQAEVCSRQNSQWKDSKTGV